MVVVVALRAGCAFVVDGIAVGIGRGIALAAFAVVLGAGGAPIVRADDRCIVGAACAFAVYNVRSVLVATIVTASSAGIADNARAVSATQLSSCITLAACATAVDNAWEVGCIAADASPLAFAFDCLLISASFWFGLHSGGGKSASTCALRVLSFERAASSTDDVHPISEEFTD